jgi:hypothetical protein
MIPISTIPLVTAFALGAAIGGTAAYKVQSITISGLRADIANTQYQAQAQLNEANNAVKEIEAAQVKNIIEIQEQANEAINTNHSLADQLKSLRLQHAQAIAYKARLSKACDTRDTKDATEAAHISARYNQFIDERAAIADYNTAYAQAAYKFVQSIPKEMIK